MVEIRTKHEVEVDGVTGGSFSVSSPAIPNKRLEEVELCISEGGGGPMDDSPKTASINITKAAWRDLIAKVQYLLLDEGD